MKTELHKIIDEKFDWSEFQELVREEGYKELATDFKAKTGLDFKFLESKRTKGSGDYDGYVWRWKIDDKFYEVEGYYSSWDGTNLDDIRDFHEVKPVEKTIIVYEKVK